MKEVWFLRGQVITAATSGADMEGDNTPQTDPHKPVAATTGSLTINH